MKQIISLFFFFLYSSHLFAEGHSFIDLTPLSSLADLFVYDDHVQIELKVHRNSLKKIVKVNFTKHELASYDSQSILDKLIQNQTQVEKAFKKHLKISKNSKVLDMQYKNCSFEHEGYINFNIDFPFFDAESINSISFIYDYPKDPSGYDSLPLTISDQRVKESIKKTALLHGTRKKLIWTPLSLETKIVSTNADYQFYTYFIILAVSTIFIIFLPAFISLIRSEYND